MTGLEDQRARERQKYRELLRRHPRYGTTVHGRGALSLLTRQCAEILNPVILDVGCGDNQFAKTLRRRAYRAWGVDFADPRADVTASAHALPWPEKTFHWLTSFDVLEHLLPEEIDEVLAEFARVTRIGWIFSICYRDSTNRTADGSTLHPTVRSEAWWIDKLSSWIQVEHYDHYLYGRLHPL